MGLRGPAPKPTAIRVFEGMAGHRPLNALEPKYQPGIPVRPAHLSRSARKIWDSLIFEMAMSGVLRAVDGEALGQLCEDTALLTDIRAGMAKTVADIEKAARMKKKKLSGGALLAFTQTTAGRRTLSTMRELSSQIIVQRREFGLTPASNSRVNGAGLVSAADGHSANRFDPLESALCAGLPS